MALDAAWLAHLVGWGSAAILVSGSALVVVLFAAPYAFLQDHPADVRAAARPASRRERRSALLAGTGFLTVLLLALGATVLGWALSHEGSDLGELLLMAAALILAFDLFDLVVIDWLLICALRPRGILIPGTEHCTGWRDWRHHYRELLRWRAIAVAVVGTLLLGGGAWLLSR